MPRVSQHTPPAPASAPPHQAVGIAVRVTCKSDPNGNPRRGWMIYRVNGDYAGFADEGYQGSRALDAVVSELYGTGISWSGRGYEHLSEVGNVEITPGQFRALLRDRFPLARKAGQ